MNCKLSDIAEVTMGQSPKSEYYNSDGKGMPFLQGNRTFGSKIPTFDTYTTFATKIAKAGDVIMSVRAPVGDLNIAPVDLCLGRGVCSLHMKNGNQEFLFYLLKHYMPQLLNKESGTVFGSVNRNDICSLGVNIPNDVSTQFKISRFLGILDDKIALNSAINCNLEQQAQALFKSWFVYFEPFGGVMPDDWLISNLGDVSEMSVGGDKPKNYTSTPTATNTIPIYSNGLTDEGLYGYTNLAKIQEESVTVSARGTIGFVCLRQIPYFPIVRLITLIPKKEIISAKYLYHWLKTLHIAGTGTTQQQLTVPSFKNTKIMVPNHTTMERFTNTVNSFYKQIFANKNENQHLAATRDTLLPKLMNGEIDISDVKI